MATAQKNGLVKTRTKKFHIYKVEVNDEIKLIRATTKAKALKVAVSNIMIAIPTPDELVDLVKQGIDVEESKA